MLYELVTKPYQTLSGLQYCVRQKGLDADLAQFKHKPDAELFLTLLNCYACRKNVRAAEEHTHTRPA